MASGKLRREIGKKRPFGTLEEEAMLNLFRTSDQVQIRFTRLFREYGLTSSQYNVLRILRGEGKPLPILEVAGRTVTVVPGITGLIDRLEQAGWVRRERCPTIAGSSSSPSPSRPWNSWPGSTGRSGSCRRGSSLTWRKPSWRP